MEKLQNGLWGVSAPPAPATSRLTSAISADVAVIGAGYTGLSAALHLAEAGASVVVLEAAKIGHGGSGRNAGLVNAGMWVLPSVVENELGPVYGPRLLKLLSDAPALVFDLVKRHGIACDPVHNGTLQCAVDKNGLNDITERNRQWQALGAPVRLIDANETARKVGSGAYCGALLDSRAGTIQPLAYAQGLAQAALQAGARIYTDSAASGLDSNGQQWTVHAASGGQVNARWIIVATNVYSDENGLWSQLRGELVCLPYFNLATTPLPESLRKTILPDGQGASDTRKILSSYHLDRHGRLVFGSVGTLRGTGLSTHKNWGRRAISRLFPQLSDITFEHQWYGHIGMTANALPRFHYLDHRIVSISGYNGRGIAPGTTFGRELARLVLGKINDNELPLPVTPITPARMPGIREFGYTLGTQAFHMLDARF